MTTRADDPRADDRVVARLEELGDRQRHFPRNVLRFEDTLSHVSERRRLFHDLIRFETELWDGVDRRLRATVELPLSWFEPMAIIDEREVCRVNDIADALSITAGGTSKLVDRIEAAGLCERRPNPDDRRSSLITLTPAGEQRLADAEVEFDAELVRWLPVPDSTLNRFQAVLRRLRANARTLRHHDVPDADHG